MKTLPDHTYIVIQHSYCAPGAAASTRTFTSAPTSQSNAKPGSIRNDGIRQHGQVQSYL